MTAKIKVTCKRCQGTGKVAHSIHCEGICFNCRGVGHYFRKPATKRQTREEYFAEVNARAEAARAARQ